MYVQGFGIGAGLAIDPLYIAEVSPSMFRGKLVSMSELAINFGILLGMAADYCFLTLPEGTNWRVMIGLGLILPCVLLVMTLTIMPESPR
jgi:MFS family permease